MIRYDPAKPLISLHIPKCAGQSFRRVLEQWYDGCFFVHYYQQHNAPPPKHGLKPGICIHGHFNRAKGFGVKDYYPGVRQFIAIFRDPLSAAISNYFFWKSKAKEMQLQKGIIKPGDDNDYRDIDDFFRKRPKSNMLDFLPWQMSAENYKELIDANFAWIGLVETLQSSINRLARILGKPEAEVPKINSSVRDEELSPELRDAFLESSRLEIDIFNYAKSLIVDEKNMIAKDTQ